MLTQTQVVTAPAIEVMVFVNQNGDPVSTSTMGVAAPTPVPAPVDDEVQPIQPAPAAPTPVDSYEPEEEDTEEDPVVEASPPPPPPATQESSAAAPPAAEQTATAEAVPSPPADSGDAPASGGVGGFGISYTGYTDDGKCKTKEQVDADFAKINGFSVVRLYGTDCNQLENVVPAARAKGMQVFVGISTQNVLEGKHMKDVELLTKVVGGSWDVVHTVGVANELVNAGGDVNVALKALREVKPALQAQGYGGPVVIVDTFIAMINEPRICAESDYAAANIHAFFDSLTPASGAGSFLATQAAAVAKACQGKKVVITETGWPNDGQNNNVAHPGRPEQQAALDSIRASFTSDVILFSAFDEKWKKDTAHTFGCEKHWGILG